MSKFVKGLVALSFVAVVAACAQQEEPPVFVETEVEVDTAGGKYK
ncbi:hypothetical protein [Actibacterium mucosum]|nr:hypothetical protein [Actibacterium mucosum]